MFAGFFLFLKGCIGQPERKSKFAWRNGGQLTLRDKLEDKREIRVTDLF